MHPDDTPPICDEPDVIAEAGDYELTKDGYLLVKYEGAPRPRVEDFPALLADGLRRVREKLTHDEQGYMGTVRSARSAATERADSLAERIETLDESVRQDHVAMHELEIRLAAVEDLVNEAIPDRLDAVTKRVAAVEKGYQALSDALAEETGNQRSRLAALERDLSSVDSNSRITADRVSALESRQDRDDDGRMVDLEGRVEGMAQRLVKLEAKQGYEERLWNSLDVIGGRVDALWARQQDEIPGKPFPESWKQDEAGDEVDEIVTRLFSHEATDRSGNVIQPNQTPIAGWIQRQYLSGTRIDRDEATEGNTNHEDLHCLSDAAIGVLKDHARREMAREIVERLRGGDADCFAGTLGEVIQWIEREFGGE